MKVLEQQCKAMRETDAHVGEQEGNGNDCAEAPLRLSREEMQRELEHREHLLRLKPASAGTDGNVETD